MSCLVFALRERCTQSDIVWIMGIFWNNSVSIKVDELAQTGTSYKIAFGFSFHLFIGLFSCWKINAAL